MDTAAVCDRVGRISATRAAVSAGTAAVVDVEGGLHDIRMIRSHLARVEAEFVTALAPAVSFPESTIADTSRGSLGEATKTIDRAGTLADAPALADALDNAAITAEHIDALTRATKGLDEQQRVELIDIADALTDVASHATVEQFNRRLRNERRRLLADEGVARLEQQRRNTSMRTWVDDDGMWNVRGRYDPVTGVELAAALDQAIETLFAETTPEHCPTDPMLKQSFLRAHAFARLVEGTAGRRRSGRPEFVVVIDADADVEGEPTVDWSIPVEIPPSVLTELLDDGVEPIGIVVRNGVVLHAPGVLDLGRQSRLANRAQRRALNALYDTCAIPGCSTRYATTKLHHIVWWRHGGRTDLSNLLPLCSHHHGKVHHDDWQITLGPSRELTVRFPDGSVQTTGPPRRRAAA
jgi:HNH endonuclease